MSLARLRVLPLALLAGCGCDFSLCGQSLTVDLGEGPWAQGTYDIFVATEAADRMCTVTILESGGLGSTDCGEDGTRVEQVDGSLSLVAPIVDREGEVLVEVSFLAPESPEPSILLHARFPSTVWSASTPNGPTCGECWSGNVSAEVPSMAD